ncbi:putative quinol monooxygenase [Mangrovihabitans endophyticus]|uniref:ABM domain-containing protein n=1 Tax=Mangrovihabitans endophyticus TaxID=1751298 RepID=A0A8J3C4T6_9ACTN|nr:putative quinol monooxygenase [Mangrovihabitans endophyticus]GGL09428.1 hypothetical protein GCM10012284_50140 [Mangrovihabitans endophyticus]
MRPGDGPPATPVLADRSGSPPVRIVARWRAAPETADRVRSILRELAGRSSAEHGCLRFDVWEATTEPGRFVLLEEYADVTARDAHVATAHFRDLVLAQAAPLLTHREVGEYAPLSSTGG